jgi:hypothetical protein
VKPRIPVAALSGSHPRARRVVLTAFIACAASAPAAHADVSYGGGATDGTRQTGPGLGLTVHDDGRVTGRVLFAYHCGRRTVIYDQVIKVTGRVDGAAFTATGRKRIGKWRVRFNVAGAIAPDTVTGKVEQRSRCNNRSHPYVLRAASTPVGAAVAAAPNSLMYGVTSQTVAGVRIPVTVRVTKQGRAYVNEYARANCGRFTWEVTNAMASTKVKPDGTFARTEHWSIRYSDGWRGRYTVNTSGRFLADGATGTFRIRLTYRKGRKRGHCDTGVLSWAARP